MIFQHSWQKVLSGEKFQTRRIVKPRTVFPKDDRPGETDGDWLKDDTVWTANPCKPGKGFWGLNYTKATPKYRIGSTYAVQPARGQKAVGRIRVTGILRERACDISDEDVKAEGFSNKTEFLKVWQSMHGTNYDCWVLTFELVQDAS